jgi:RNase P subunit RPR2
MDENENIEQIFPRLDFLYSAAHQLYATNPENCGFLLLEFSRLAAAENVQLPLSVTSTFCQRCGSLSLPGVNTNVEVQTKGRPKAFILNPNRKSKKDDKIVNYIIHTCKICHSVAQINGQSEKEVEKMQPKPEVKIKSVQTKKKKKKSNTSLADMLSKKTESKVTGFSLNDFLSTL